MVEVKLDSHLRELHNYTKKSIGDDAFQENPMEHKKGRMVLVFAVIAVCMWQALDLNVLEILSSNAWIIWG